MTPRTYQTKAIQDIKQAFKDGYKNIAISLCGGAGKSLVAKMILDLAAGKNSKIGFFSYRTLLVEQIKTYNIPNCTIGTLQKYGKEQTELFDLVIVDESWGENSKLKNNINARYMITLSGSPITSDGYALDCYDYIVKGVQFPELVELGFAKKLKVFSTMNIDTSNLKKQGGDFSIKESYELMDKSKIYNDIIGAYKQYAIDRKVMLFAVNTEHAEHLKDEFNKAGIIADTIHSKKKTNNILKDFDSGIIKVLISISKLNVGYDNPSVNCIILARPIKSIPLMFQTVWRGTRKYKDDDCLVLDLANCVRDSIHPMQKIDFSRKKQDKQPKCKKCKSEVKLIDRKIEIIDKYEYIIYSTYKCIDCDNIQEVENIKLFNLSICEGCGDEFESKNGLQIEQGNNSINFNIECAKCGHSRKFREILLSDEELKEVTLKEALENTETWEQVLIVLKAEVKKDGYKWQFSNRLLEHCKNKKFTPREVVEHIKRIRLNGKKISMLNYI